MNEKLKEAISESQKHSFFNKKDKKELLKEPALFNGIVSSNDVNLSKPIAAATTGEEFIKRVMYAKKLF